MSCISEDQGEAIINAWIFSQLYFFKGPKPEHLKKSNDQCQPDLNIQVESVVEVSTPEEMGEAQADVEGTELFVAQRKQSEDVHNVLVPPEHDAHYKRQF